MSHCSNWSPPCRQAVGNGFSILFGKGYQVKIVPEGEGASSAVQVMLVTVIHCVLFLVVVMCLLVSMFVSALVHRVSATTW